MTIHIYSCLRVSCHQNRKEKEFLTGVFRPQCRRRKLSKTDWLFIYLIVVPVQSCWMWGWELRLKIRDPITGPHYQYHAIFVRAGISFHKASTTLGLDLCPPASPEFTGPWNEMPRPLMVITLKLHPFHISHLFLNVKWNLPHLNFDFSTLLPSKIVVKCEIEMRPAPPPSLMNSGHRSKLKVVLA